VALGGRVPILIAPAMHSHMGLNPAVLENLEKLKSWGVGLIPSVSAEGEEKIAGPEDVAAAVLHRLAAGPWAGRRAVVIGGAARESIDSVRSVTNESSGATAVAIASQAYFRGAEVELWAGSIEVAVPSWIPVTRWRGVESLLDLARQRRADLAAAAAVLVPAALSDYIPPRESGKISSRDRPTLTLTLERAPKVLPTLRRLAPLPTRLVAFKLEAGQDAATLEREGRKLRDETGADWVIANDVATMGSAETNALVLPRDGSRHWVRGPKREFAGKLLDDLGRELGNIEAGAAPARTGRATVRRPRRRRPHDGH